MKRPRFLSTRLALIAALLMLTLASLSVGNALWSETLVINGNAATGQMSVQWINGPTDISVTEFDPLLVGQLNCYRDSSDFHLVHVDLVNAYPTYQVACSFSWENDGTIPVQVQSLDINGTSVASNVAVQLNLAGDAQPDLEIKLTGQINSIFDEPPPPNGGSNAITIKVLPGAPQGETITFAAHVNLIQGPHPAP